MNSLVPLLGEALVLVALVCVAHLATRPLRRRQAEDDGGNMDLASAVTMPLAVAAVSWVLHQGAVRCPAVAGLLPPEWPVHLKAWILFWCVVLAVRTVESLASRYYLRQKRRMPIPDLLRSILRAAIYVAAAFGVLGGIVGMNIAPLLTSTALLTAVVGFALQGVLGNLLAGMSLHLVRSVVPGDWVSVADIEGRIVETNWRETRLRTVAGQTMIVPNSKMAEAVIHNMTQPTDLRRHKLEVGASYADAPELVIATLVEAAQSVPGVLADPPPSAYLTEFKDFGINYRLRFWSHTFHDRTALEGDVARMVWYKFKRRGIEIPFPMSDKLLSDFMEVVYKQKTQPPPDRELERRVNDLMKSDFFSQTLINHEGKPLVTREEVQSIAHRLRHVLFTRGETIFRQGDGGENCYVLVRGKVRGEIEQPGVSERARFERGAGAVIGEMSLVTGLPRTATVTCGEEVEMLEISGDAFAHLLSLRKEIPEILSQVVAHRAEQNAARLAEVRSREVPAATQQAVRQENILQRFLHLLQRRSRS
jgi:small-conductance mechanosensitive channel/CRP-like cAMP-binding protein